MCNCDNDKNTVAPVIANSATSGLAEDSEYVLAMYDTGTRGAHMVYGQSSPKKNYGYREGGDVFLVHKNDVKLQPHLFVCPNGEPFAGDFSCASEHVQVIEPPPPPEPIKKEEEKTEEDIRLEQIEELKGMSGVGPATATLLHKAGFTTVKQVVEATDNDLVAAGIRAGTVARIKR